MSAHQNPPKRPRLSLQIKTIANGPNLRGSRTVAAAVNPTSPTAFNTLSNVYVTAIDRATPVTAINTSASQPLRIQTQDLNRDNHHQHQQQQQQQHGSHTPYASTYLDTPLTAQPLSPGAAAPVPVQFPSTMTATPPLSSGPVDDADPKPFSFSAEDTASAAAAGPTSGPSWAIAGFPPSSASTPAGGFSRRRATLPLTVSSSSSGIPLPYVRNRSLHSILRNSPLPPPTARTPVSPRRQSLRLAEKAARRVGYGSPIEQEIVNNEYVKSHIDLLADEVSPRSASSPSGTTPGGVSSPNDQMVLDSTMAYTGDETRDGGQTPGPFEEMRRRMAGLATRTPTSPTVPASSSSSSSSPSGIRKRRKTTSKETKRRWVWTIGTQEDDADDREVGGAIAAIRAAARAQAQAQAEAEAKGQPQAGPGTTDCSTAGAGAASTAMPKLVVQPVAPSPAEIPTPSIETFDEAAAEAEDVVMSESEAEAETDPAEGTSSAGGLAVGADMEVDLVTPTVARRNNAHLRSARQDSEGLFNSETGSRRDTPIPADLIS
ncbi:hypothetical protein KVR01_010066 [Diaporthe batatas]|uniref:uncharacterized protein n=1 Tax=Diaporthe batatas TaxID=748121 RepID=UPI001D04D9FA|nr:uncharacterized protein KVR01_010066 [Diaporthe batatas]KAG8160530.1 hypothetical protein KVR01_010066 [Diaporthe batatas]